MANLGNSIRPKGKSFHSIMRAVMAAISEPDTSVVHISDSLHTARHHMQYAAHIVQPLGEFAKVRLTDMWIVFDNGSRVNFVSGRDTYWVKGNRHRRFFIDHYAFEEGLTPVELRGKVEV